MSTKLSIIIPTYNSIDTLIKCIQTIHFTIEHEIIIIDDGSTDDTKAKIDQITKCNSNIKYVYQVNAGVSSARNRGLEVASGEYVYFIDADDFLISSFSVEVSLLSHNDVDLFIFGYELEESPNNKICFDKNFNINLNSNFKEFIQNFFITKTYRTAVWNKIYKREILLNKKIKFHSYNEVWSEDTLFNIEYIFLEGVKKVCISNQAIIMHTKNLGSLSNAKTQKNVESRIISSINKILEKNLNDKFSGLNQYYIVDYILKFSIAHICINQVSYNQFKLNLKNIPDQLHNNYRENLKLLSFSKLYKSKIKLFYHLLIFYLFKLRMDNLLCLLLWKRYKK